MNLLDYHRTSPRIVSERIEAEARRLGHAVREYELVGCAPADAFAGWPDTLAPVANLKPTQLLDSSLFRAAA
jgi:glutamate formiminotransferase